MMVTENLTDGEYYGGGDFVVVVDDDAVVAADKGFDVAVAAAVAEQPIGEDWLPLWIYFENFDSLKI